MLKYLKNDVSDLLKNGLDSNALGRVINYTIYLDFAIVPTIYCGVFMHVPVCDSSFFFFGGKIGGRAMERDEFIKLL